MARPDDQPLEAIARESRPEFTLRYLFEETAWHYLRFCYFERDDLWRLDFTTESGAPIVQGLVILEGRDVLAPLHAYDVPPGQLFAVDVSGQGAHPGRLAWQTTHRLYYRRASVVALAVGTADEVV